MPIAQIEQPEMRWIEKGLRLRKYRVEDGVDFAYGWYQDPEILLPMDGEVKPYSREGIAEMYRYLAEHGELYVIEYREGMQFRPIGDVTFWQEDMPITIGRRDLHGRGIGKKVVRNLIERGKELGYSRLYVKEIYDFNLASQRMFEACGFQRVGSTGNGWRYAMRLS
jgi:RimJ/RimL family protein N-acetyltransferase